MALCLGLPGWAGTGRNIHPLTPILIINHSFFITFFRLLWFTASSLFSLHACQCFCTTSLQVFFGLLFDLESTSDSVHFFTQSLSSFRNTYPYHRNLFCCNTEIVSSNPSLSLNPPCSIYMLVSVFAQPLSKFSLVYFLIWNLLQTLSFTLTLHFYSCVRSST